MKNDVVRKSSTKRISCQAETLAYSNLIANLPYIIRFETAYNYQSLSKRLKYVKSKYMCSKTLRPSRERMDTHYVCNTL